MLLTIAVESRFFQAEFAVVVLCSGLRFLCLRLKIVDFLPSSPPSPFFCSVKSVVAALVADAFVCVDAVDKFGETPLHKV